MTPTKLSRMLFSLALGATLTVGCGGGSPLGTDGGAGKDAAAGAGGDAGTTGSAGQGGAGTTGSAGQGGAGTTGTAGTLGSQESCDELPEAQCTAKKICRWASCPCWGENGTFCYNPSRLAVDCFCPPPCLGLFEAACTARTDCRADYCPTCTGNAFLRCSMTTVAPTECAQPTCPVPCSTVTTLDACEARTDCHSVFQDPGTCGCAASGCCARFSACADGDKATCKGTPLCKIVAPHCESPYVISYTGTCYEGCVKPTDCSP